MADATCPHLCLDCSAPLRQKTVGKRWPERCPDCAGRRRGRLNRIKEANRVRPSRAKPPEPPRKCLDCDELVHKSKTKWPQRCPTHGFEHMNKMRRERWSARCAARDTAAVACVGCQAQVPRGARLVRHPRCSECAKARNNRRARELRAENPDRFAAAEARWRSQNKARVREKVSRRRAKRAGVEHEVFKNIDIFERDKWICQIGRHRVDRTVSFPHPLYPTIDHIVPISEGGAHTRANVRLACFRCNCQRSDRGGNEQLALIG